MDKILIFIPMYNCEKQIIRVLEQFKKAESMQHISEIIVVNNRSNDSSEEVAINFAKTHTELPIKILRNNKNYGLGGSHKVAFDYAIKNNFNYVIVLHGDAQADIADIIPYLQNYDYKDYDCLLGARFMKGSKLHGYSKFRTFGNLVYNVLFSLGIGKKIYDLGSGLNMYNVDILKNKFYLKFKDNLVFNYCMVLGNAYYNHKIKFFPILWKEDDQISNVKLASQAISVLILLISYIFNKQKFIEKEHRDYIIDNYDAKFVGE